jgi:hypothetical protein
MIRSLPIAVLASEESLSAFVAAFEAGTYPVAQFHHAEHLALAACYLLESDADATARIRADIRRYNEAQGGKNTDDAGYHETLTLFWLALIHANLPANARRLEAVRCIVDTFARRRDLFREYYSFDVVKSKEARLSWVSPDLPGPDGASFAGPLWEKIQS